MCRTPRRWILEEIGIPLSPRLQGRPGKPARLREDEMSPECCCEEMLRGPGWSCQRGSPLRSERSPTGGVPPVIDPEAADRKYRRGQKCDRDCARWMQDC